MMIHSRRMVTVNWNRNLLQALEATGRRVTSCQDELEKCARNMPVIKARSGEFEVAFFFLDYFPLEEELEREYASRGLIPVDPYSLAAVYEDNPFFAPAFQCESYWNDQNGHRCHIQFHQRYGLIDVEVGHSGPRAQYPERHTDVMFAGMHKTD